MEGKTLDKSTLLKFYKRDDIQTAIIENASNREVAINFGGKGYGKRPDILRYKRDILELAMRGATSFHISEERWTNPLALDTSLKKEELDKMRAGWDFIIDIDCHFLEYSKMAAYLIIKVLKYYNIHSISCKFSGNKGFHIGVPFESFPLKIGRADTQFLFPDAPKRIAMYIKEKINNPLADMIIEHENGSFLEVFKKTGVAEKGDIIKKEVDNTGNLIERLDVEPFLEIDTLLISSRHLYRSVYSFNEKSGLVSIPISPDRALLFNKSEALSENIKPSRYKFLDNSESKNNECVQLVTEAFDFKPDLPPEEETIKKVYTEFDAVSEAIPIELFPPCIHNILKGIRDGKKRALFILHNFLLSCGWGYEEIDLISKEWNKKNPEKLRENILIGQLRYRKAQKKKILPPNCANTIYKDVKVCIPDSFCLKIKNPVNYAILKKRFLKTKKNKKKKD